MNAAEFIELVEEQQANHWANSDIPAIGEQFMEAVADHYLHCVECRESFDFMKYPHETLLELWRDVMSAGYVDGWICHRPIAGREGEDVR